MPDTKLYNQFIAVLSVLLGVLAVGTCLFLWYRLHMNIPERDTIPMIPLIRPTVEGGLTSVSFSDWIHPHFSSHRIALIRLLMAADFNFGHGLNYFFYSASFASVIVVVLIYGYAQRTSSIESGISPIFYMGFLLLIAFSPTQIWNFIQPIGTSWFLVNVLMTAGVWCLIVNRRELTPGMACLGFIFCALGTLANFSAVVSLIMLPGIVFLRCRKLAAPMFVLCAAWIVLYMQDIHRPIAIIQQSAEYMAQVAADIESKGLILYYLDKAYQPILATLTFLSAPFSAGGTLLSSLIALASVFYLAYLWIQLFPRGQFSLGSEDRWFLLCLFMATTCAGIAIVIYFGRQGFPYLPQPPRYRTVVVFYWLNICSLLFANVCYSEKSHRQQNLRKLATLGIGVAYLFLATDKMPSIMSSSKIAARNTAMGTLGISPKDNLSDPFLPPKLARLSHYHDYLLQSGMGYGYYRKMDAHSSPDENDLAECGSIRLRLKKSLVDDTFGVQLTAEGEVFLLTRRIYLRKGSQLVGYLYPAFSGVEDQAAALLSKNQKWLGFITQHELTGLLLQPRGLLSSAPDCAL